MLRQSVVRGILSLFGVVFIAGGQGLWAFECDDSISRLKTVTSDELVTRLYPRSSEVWTLLELNHFEIDRWQDGIPVLVSKADYPHSPFRGFSGDIHVHFSNGVTPYRGMTLEYIVVNGDSPSEGGLIVLVRDISKRVLFVAIAPGTEENSILVKREARRIYHGEN